MRRSHKHLPGLNDPSLAPLQAALTADATADELSGEANVLTAYRAVSWRRGRSVWRPAVFATKLGVATVAGVLGLSGVATAAYTGSLPDTLQDVAHKTIKAPKAHPPAQAVGPDATGEAAYGLCQAFAKDKEPKTTKQSEPKATPTHEPQGQGKGLANKKDHATGADKERGQAKEKSVAYRNLVRAAGGEDKVAAYCAAVPKPSGEPESSDSTTHGKPTEKPSHPSGKPGSASSRATAKP
ncbi:MAG: hypothetical protein M3P04_13280 [Actinomycetota bacterium]|nr:hypothetical protein [Actinomycetota bacterium]